MPLHRIYFAALKNLNMVKKNFWLFLIILLCGINGNAQSTLFGTVEDEAGNPIEGADVFVDGTDYYYYTEADGTFVIPVEPGTYTFTVSSFGFDEYSKEITLEPDQKLEWTPILKVQSSDAVTQDLGTIMVKADPISKESEVATLNEQRKSIEIKEIKGAEELSRLGKTNAAQAVASIAGVSKQLGTSDVFVRGLGDRYLSTTLNGLYIPSNDINKKNIDLNLFPSEVIQSVSVSKTFSSNFNGDFAAGLVDIVSKEQTGKDFISVGIGSKVNTNSLGEDFVQSEGTNYFGLYGRYKDNPWGTVLQQQAGTEKSKGIPPFSTNLGLDFGKTFRFKNNAKLSLFVTSGFENGFNYVDGYEQNFTGNRIVEFPHVKKYEYWTTSTAMANAVMRFNAKNKLSYHSLFINASNDETGYYGYKAQGTQRDVDNSYFQQNIQFDQDLLWVNQIGGQHDLTDKITFDWALAYNLLRSNEPDRKRYTISNYENIIDDDPNTVGNFYSTTGFNNQRYFQDIDDNEVNNLLQFSYRANDNLTVRLGGKARYKHRDFENIRIGYEILQDQIASLDDITDFFSLENWEVNYNTVVINPIAVNDENGNPVVNLSNKNLPGLPENTYQAHITNFGSFINAEWKINDKLLIVPGLRLEDFRQGIQWDVNNLALNNPGESQAHETLLLPNLNVKYEVKDDMNLRFSGSNTVSFPEFKEFAPFVYEGVTQRIGGNPDLLGRTANIDYTNVPDVSYSNIYNFDFKYEWFFSKKEILSLAAFYKDIKDPINLVVGTSATGDEYYFRTGEKASVFGLELEAKKTLFDSGNQEMFMGLNGSFMNTKQDLYPSIVGTRSVSFNRNEDQLQGASKWIGNIDLNYRIEFNSKVEQTFTLVGNYFSDRIFSLGSGQIGNKMEKGIPTLDFLIATQFGKKAKLKFSLKNLLNPNYEIYREQEAGPNITLSKYKLGRIISLGFDYKF